MHERLKEQAQKGKDKIDFKNVKKHKISRIKRKSSILLPYGAGLQMG